MRSVHGMAATRTDVSLDEMTKFIKRGFHALHPKQSVVNGEIVFDLHLGRIGGIRVWTTIGQNSTMSAEVGSDAIRVQLINLVRNRPLVPGNAPIVKRTQGWKDNLQDRIEDTMEKYDEREEDIEAGRFIDWNSPPRHV